MRSPDGKWWWDGSRWVPAAETPSRPSISPDTRGVLRFVPGFRSGRWQYAVVATVLYGLCALGAVAGAAAGSLAEVGFWLSLAALGVAGTYLVWYRARPRRLLPLAVVVLAMASCGASAANLPSAGTNRANANRPAPTATAVAVATDTAAATPTATPTPAPTAAATPTPPPTPTPTPPAAVAAPVHATSTPAPPPPPAPNLCGAPANPWGYNFCGGATITAKNTPAGFCSYFACILNFPNGQGYVEECMDGMFGGSGGIQGSCSHHGGNKRPLYA